MRALVLAAGAILVLSSPVNAGSTRVGGYVTKNGTYVPSHQRTTPNATKADNWSSKPNYNPYTGKQGTVDPYKPKTRGY